MMLLMSLLVACFVGVVVILLNKRIWYTVVGTALILHRQHLIYFITHMIYFIPALSFIIFTSIIVYYFRYLVDVLMIIFFPLFYSLPIFIGNGI